jgi:hypothetical protein
MQCRAHCMHSMTPPPPRVAALGADLVAPDGILSRDDPRNVPFRMLFKAITGEVYGITVWPHEPFCDVHQRVCLFALWTAVRARGCPPLFLYRRGTLLRQPVPRTYAIQSRRGM